MPSLSTESSPAAQHAREAAVRLSLPLRTGLARTNGNVPGTGAGSSVDFQDHRAYVPGDDPRHIDWLAYARSGHYTMKLYREEVRPYLDLVMDLSTSMFLDEAKSNRTQELAYFCRESALQNSASSRFFLLKDDGLSLWDNEADLPLPPSRPAASNAEPISTHLSRIPWRSGSLRVLISDLLFSADPSILLPHLVSAQGRLVIFAPYCEAESQPDWLGNTRLIDCEDIISRDLHLQRSHMEAYLQAYQNHFDFWVTACLRQAIPFARVKADGSPLLNALASTALPAGAVHILA
jgi:uncharacterized protein (DUF58 family)